MATHTHGVLIISMVGVSVSNVDEIILRRDRCGLGVLLGLFFLDLFSIFILIHLLLRRPRLLGDVFPLADHLLLTHLVEACALAQEEAEGLFAVHAVIREIQWVQTEDVLAIDIATILLEQLDSLGAPAYIASEKEVEEEHGHKSFALLVAAAMTHACFVGCVNVFMEKGVLIVPCSACPVHCGTAAVYISDLHIRAQPQQCVQGINLRDYRTKDRSIG